MWMAWLSRRFPRLLSRLTFRCPEETSIGAVPLQDAKWSRFLKRDTSRTSPMTAAAMTGPTPNSPVRLVPDARTAASGFFLVSRSCPSMRRRSSMKAAARSRRAAATASGGVIESSSRAA
jgi:hypothetical protein